MKLLPLKFHKGFTLIEVMVSVSIFTIIVTVGIIALLTINDAYRKSQTQRQAIDSLTYMMESMSRRIRTAATWDGAGYDLLPTTSFAIHDQDNIGVTYTWDQVKGELLMSISDPASIDPGVPTTTGIPYNLTPENVHITNTLPDGTLLPGGGVTFKALKTNPSGQGYVQINIGGYVTNGKEVTPFSFQTGISKRVTD